MSNYEHLISGKIISAIHYEGTLESAALVSKFIGLKNKIDVYVWKDIFGGEFNLDFLSCTFEKIVVNITYKDRTTSKHRVYTGDYFTKNQSGNVFETYESANFFQHYRKIL